MAASEEIVSVRRKDRTGKIVTVGCLPFHANSAEGIAAAFAWCERINGAGDCEVVTSEMLRKEQHDDDLRESHS